MVLSCPLVTTLVTCSLLQDFSGGGGAICIQQAEQAIEWQLSRFAAADPCQSLRSSDSRDSIILESQSIRKLIDPLWQTRSSEFQEVPGN